MRTYKLLQISFFDFKSHLAKAYTSVMRLQALGLLC